MTQVSIIRRKHRDASLVGTAPATLLEASGKEHIATAMGTNPAKAAALKQSSHSHSKRTDPAKQIAALKQAIDAENAYIRNLLSRGDFETAAKRLEWQIRRKARIGELSMEWQAVKASQAVTVETVHRKAKTRMIIKPKRYSRWSEKK